MTDTSDRHAHSKESPATTPDNLGEYRSGAHTKPTQAEIDAQRVIKVAADDLSPLRRDPAFWGRDYPPLPKMTTSITEEMAQLNRDPKRLDAALKVMQEQPNKTDGLNVTVKTDGAGKATEATFSIPGTEHYMGQAHRYSILNPTDEKNAQKIATLMGNTPEPMNYQQLKGLANTLKSYSGNEHALDRMLTNVAFELGKHNHKAQVGLGTYGGEHDAALMVYGVTSPTMFHSDGRITKFETK